MGGGSDKAQKQAQAAEDERQRQIKASTAAINSIFTDPSRQAQYDDITKATTDFYTGDVNRQHDVEARQLLFALARSGQAGGSEGAYKNKVLGQDYVRGLNTAAQKGYQAGASLRQADEDSRAQLLALAQSGVDATTASDQATRSLQSNLMANKGSATANSIGDLFGDLGDFIQQSNAQKQAKQGYLYGYGSVYQPMYGVGAQNNAIYGGQ